MSVLIKGMDMPKSGTYEVSIDNTNGKDKTIMSMFVRGSGGLICCGVYEIVPVPPHGRLIDADALMARFEKEEKAADEHGRDFSFSFKSGGENCTEWWPVQQMLMDAPTIIEAEEEASE